MTMPQGTVPLELSTPIHLTATTSLASNTTGGVNTVALKNPMGGAMEVHEIKFQVTGPLSQTNANVFGGIIAAKLDIGSHPLTNGYVPIWSLGRSLGLGAENLIRNVNNAISEFSWRLARPLYVPADAVITPTFQHRGLITNSLSVRVSYVGRSFNRRGPLPQKVYIPYASAYVSKNFSIDSADTDESTELELINPFDSPLFIQRFTGRCQFYWNDGSANNYATDSQMGSIVSGGQLMTVRMVDSNGRPIIRNFTVFYTAFPQPTRSWELDGKAVMDPQSYYRVFTRKSAPTAALNIPATTQIFVGCVGWREIGTGEMK